MPIAAEVQSWIDEMKKSGFTDEELKPFLTKVEQNEAAQNALKGSVTATADYHRHMQELKKLKEQEQTELKKTEAWAAKLAEWEGQKNSEYRGALLKQADAEAKLQQVRQRIDALKTSGYINEDDFKDVFDSATISGAGGNPPVKPPEHKAEDDKYLTKQEAAAQALYAPKIAARLNKLNRQHEDLFKGTDKQFDGEALIDYATSNGLKLDDAWQQMYEVSKRRDEVREADITRRIEEARREERTKVLSEHMVNGETFKGREFEGAPVLSLNKPNTPAAEGTPQPTAKQTYEMPMQKAQRAVQKWAEQKGAA